MTSKLRQSFECRCNMKKHISSIFCTTLLPALVVLFATGCKNKEELLFDKPSNERALDLIEHCEKTLLANPNGWQMVYEVPNKDIKGKYTLQMQFMENKSVRMWADFLSEPTISSYAFSLYDGPLLTFDTPGAITHLADPSIKPYKIINGKPVKKGKGYYGENDFIIMEVSSEKILLRGLKYGNRIELTPLKEPANLTDKGHSKNYNALADILEKYNPLVPRVMSDTSRVGIVKFHIPRVPHFLPTATAELPRFMMTVKKMDDSSDPAKHSLTPINGGFIVNPALNVDGKQYSEFIFKEGNASFVAKEDEKITIKLQAFMSLSLKLIKEGGAYNTNDTFFRADNMSEELKKFFGKDTLAKIFPDFQELRLYNQPDSKYFSFYHKEEGEDREQNIIYNELTVIDEEKGIYEFRVVGLTGDGLKDTYGKTGTPINTFLVYFSSFGHGKGKVKITEQADNTIRITSLGNEKFWIDFKLNTPKVKTI